MTSRKIWNNYITFFGFGFTAGLLTGLIVPITIVGIIKAIGVYIR